VGQDARQRRRYIWRRRGGPSDGVLGGQAFVREERRPLAGKKEKGPSDPRAAKSGGEAIEGKGETFGGVDYEGSTKAELYERATELGVKGRSSMDKKELARAISRKQ
jgi:hypothetical protein